MDRIRPNGPNRTKVEQSEQIGPNRTKQSQSTHNRPNMTKVDRIDRRGQNRTNVDQIEPMWTELDRSRPNKGQCELDGPN